MEVRNAAPSDPMSSAPPLRQVGSITSTVQGTSTVSSATNAETEGKHSSGETSRMKKKQSDRLTRVKKRTLLVVVVADAVLLMALLYQMIWLNESLHAALEDRIIDLMGFYNFRYSDRFADMGKGAALYLDSADDHTTCLALAGERSAQQEIQRRFGLDMLGRGIEIALLTDAIGTVLGTGGPRDALGYRFNPQNIISDFNQLYPHTLESLQATVMVPRVDMENIYSPYYVSEGDHSGLRSWKNYTESLTRISITPVHCSGSYNIGGYIVLGDTMYPLQYSAINRLVEVTDSSMMAVFARTSTGSWQMQCSYNKPGAHGWPEKFPDLSSHFSFDFLDQLYHAGGVRTGQLSLGSIDYTFATTPVDKQKLGSAFVDNIPATAAISIHAEPNTAISRTVNTALLWHVPFGVFMTILSFVTLKHTYARFLDPMRQLIESVKKKQLKEFNERIRQLKSNRGTIYVLVGKTVLIQGVLLGLIFANMHLLRSSINEFTSATTKGRAGPFVAGSQARAMMGFLNAWTSFSDVINTSVTGNVSSQFRDGFLSKFRVLNADGIYLIGLDSKVIASNYLPCEGLVFPEVGITEYYKNVSNEDFLGGLTLSNWHPSNIDRFTVRTPSMLDAPSLLRLAFAPVSYVFFNETTNTFILGDLVGAVVVLRILNGFNPIWDTVVAAFGTGYYGLYEWDRFNHQFASVSTLLRDTNASLFGMDVSSSEPLLLDQGFPITYRTENIVVQQGSNMDGQSMTLIVAPFFTNDDIVMSPLMLSSYLVVGVPQDHFDALISRQVSIQATIMGIECLASLFALLCTYWPMKKFLDNLELAFNVPSMSAEKRQKMEGKAAAMMGTTRPDTGVAQKRASAGSVQSSMG